MTGIKHAIDPAFTDVTLDHLQRQHRVIALALHRDHVSVATAEGMHYDAHGRKIDGDGGTPMHCHTLISGVCEAAEHEDCLMIGCECWHHRVPL